LTDTPLKNDDIHLPFGIIFLDVHFCKEELADLGIKIKSKEIIGAFFQKGVLISKDTQNQVGSNLRITVLYVQDNDEVWFDTYNKNNNLFDKINKQNEIVVKENPTTDKKSRDFIHKFVLNFLNFVNNPDIKIVEQKRSEQNVKRRLKQGKTTLPSSYKIFLKGELKVYVERICNGEKFKYSHKFWVRGHFRRLESDRYKEKKILWILPFLKGNGLLIDKTYHLEKKEN
jgi:hypothetical protein